MKGGVQLSEIITKKKRKALICKTRVNTDALAECNGLNEGAHGKEGKKIWDTRTRDFEGLATVIKYNGWLLQAGRAEAPSANNGEPVGRRRDEGARRRGRSYLAPQQPSCSHYSAPRLHPGSDQHQPARQAGPLCAAREGGEEEDDGEEGGAGGDHARKYWKK